MKKQSKLSRVFSLLLISMFLCPAFVFAAATDNSAKPRSVSQTSGSKDVESEEDFKGQTKLSPTVVGAMTGLGVIDASAGFAVLGSVSQEIVRNGFVPDINNQVYVEAVAGPLFVSGGTAFVWSAHLRWDFNKDSKLTPYALGGFSGNITGASLGDRWEFFPRFGAGVLLKVTDGIRLRGEVSHEFITAGVALEL